MTAWWIVIWYVLVFVFLVVERVLVCAAYLCVYCVSLRVLRVFAYDCVSMCIPACPYCVNMHSPR